MITSHAVVVRLQRMRHAQFELYMCESPKAILAKTFGAWRLPADELLAACMYVQACSKQSNFIVGLINLLIIQKDELAS